jgi:hypothetical protein
LFYVLPLLAGVFCLSACQQGEPADVYTNLMQHPALLQNEIQACKSQDLTMKAVSAQCETVKRAGEQMSLLVEQQRSDPQEFGVHILNAEMQSAKAARDSNEVKILLAVVGLSSPE